MKAQYKRCDRDHYSQAQSRIDQRRKAHKQALLKLRDIRRAERAREKAVREAKRALESSEVAPTPVVEGAEDETRKV